eukprot:360092-Chlamydomonas_euryale.AAC.3
MELSQADLPDGSLPDARLPRGLTPPSPNQDCPGASPRLLQTRTAQGPHPAFSKPGLPRGLTPPSPNPPKFPASSCAPP